jgi:hypothetical protein
VTIDVSIDRATAQRLWDTVIRARADAPVITRAEDAVFRFYLPLALAMARTQAIWSADPELAEHAAELGLAKAVLAWRRPDAGEFVAFAQAAIAAQIRLTAEESRRFFSARRTAGLDSPPPEQATGVA